MARPGEDFFVRPSFYEALMGEFTSPLDIFPRRHTLGRLAVDTYRKGVIIFDDETQPVYAHTPSWAHITEGILVCHGDYDRVLVTMGSISVKSNSGNELTVYDAYRPELGRGLVIVDNNVTEISLPLDSEDDITAAKEAVARSAQAFFDQLVEQ